MRTSFRRVAESQVEDELLRHLPRRELLQRLAHPGAQRVLRVCDALESMLVTDADSIHSAPPVPRAVVSSARNRATELLDELVDADLAFVGESASAQLDGVSLGAPSPVALAFGGAVAVLLHARHEEPSGALLVDLYPALLRRAVTHLEQIVDAVQQDESMCESTPTGATRPTERAAAALAGSGIMHAVQCLLRAARRPLATAKHGLLRDSGSSDDTRVAGLTDVVAALAAMRHAVEKATALGQGLEDEDRAAAAAFEQVAALGGFSRAQRVQSILQTHSPGGDRLSSNLASEAVPDARPWLNRRLSTSSRLRALVRHLRREVYRGGHRPSGVARGDGGDEEKPSLQQASWNSGDTSPSAVRLMAMLFSLTPRCAEAVLDANEGSLSAAAQAAMTRHATIPQAVDASQRRANEAYSDVVAALSSALAQAEGGDESEDEEGTGRDAQEGKDGAETTSSPTTLRQGVESALESVPGGASLARDLIGVLAAGGDEARTQLATRLAKEMSRAPSGEGGDGSVSPASSQRDAPAVSTPRTPRTDGAMQGSESAASLVMADLGMARPGSALRASMAKSQASTAAAADRSLLHALMLASTAAAAAARTLTDAAADLEQLADVAVLRAGALDPSASTRLVSAAMALPLLRDAALAVPPHPGVDVNDTPRSAGSGGKDEVESTSSESDDEGNADAFGSCTATQRAAAAAAARMVPCLDPAAARAARAWSTAAEGQPAQSGPHDLLRSLAGGGALGTAFCEYMRKKHGPRGVMARTTPLAADSIAHAERVATAAVLHHTGLADEAKAVAQAALRAGAGTGGGGDRSAGASAGGAGGRHGDEEDGACPPSLPSGHVDASALYAARGSEPEGAERETPLWGREDAAASADDAGRESSLSSKAQPGVAAPVGALAPSQALVQAWQQVIRLRSWFVKQRANAVSLAAEGEADGSAPASSAPSPGRSTGASQSPAAETPTQRMTPRGRARRAYQLLARTVARRGKVLLMVKARTASAAVVPADAARDAMAFMMPDDVSEDRGGTLPLAVRARLQARAIGLALRAVGLLAFRAALGKRPTSSQCCALLTLSHLHAAQRTHESRPLLSAAPAHRALFAGAPLRDVTGAASAELHRVLARWTQQPEASAILLQLVLCPWLHPLSVEADPDTLSRLVLPSLFRTVLWTPPASARLTGPGATPRGVRRSTSRHFLASPAHGPGAKSPDGGGDGAGAAAEGDDNEDEAKLSAIAQAAVHRVALARSSAVAAVQRASWQALRLLLVCSAQEAGYLPSDRGDVLVQALRTLLGPEFLGTGPRVTTFSSTTVLLAVDAPAARHALDRLDQSELGTASLALLSTLATSPSTRARAVAASLLQAVLQRTAPETLRSHGAALAALPGWPASDDDADPAALLLDWLLLRAGGNAVARDDPGMLTTGAADATFAARAVRALLGGRAAAAGASWPALCDQALVGAVTAGLGREGADAVIRRHRHAALAGALSVLSAGLEPAVAPGAQVSVVCSGNAAEEELQRAVVLADDGARGLVLLLRGDPAEGLPNSCVRAPHALVHALHDEGDLGDVLTRTACAQSLAALPAGVARLFALQRRVARLIGEQVDALAASWRSGQGATPAVSSTEALAAASHALSFLAVCVNAWDCAPWTVSGQLTHVSALQEAEDGDGERKHAGEEGFGSLEPLFPAEARYSIVARLADLAAQPLPRASLPAAAHAAGAWEARAPLAAALEALRRTKASDLVPELDTVRSDLVVGGRAAPTAEAKMEEEEEEGEAGGAASGAPAKVRMWGFVDGAEGGDVGEDSDEEKEDGGAGEAEAGAERKEGEAKEGQGEEGPPANPQVAMLQEMGFDRFVSETVLRMTGGDLETAIGWMVADTNREELEALRQLGEARRSQAQGAGADAGQSEGEAGSDPAIHLDRLLASLQRLHVLCSKRLEEAMRKLPRHKWAPFPAPPAKVYKDTPFECKALKTVLSSPLVHARCLEALDVQPGSAVLDVGCGVGYTTALAAALAGPDGCAVGLDVYDHVNEFAWKRTRRAAAKEEEEAFPRLAERVLFASQNALLPFAPALRTAVARLRGGRGADRDPMFDRVLVGARVRVQDFPLLLRLVAPGGVLVVPVERQLLRVTKDAAGQSSAVRLSGCVFDACVQPSSRQLDACTSSPLRAAPMEPAFLREVLALTQPSGGGEVLARRQALAEAQWRVDDPGRGESDEKPAAASFVTFEPEAAYTGAGAEMQRWLQARHVLRSRRVVRHAFPGVEAWREALESGQRVRVCPRSVMPRARTGDEEPVLEPLVSNVRVTEGGLRLASRARFCSVRGTVVVRGRGKWYYEATLHSSKVLQLGWATHRFEPMQDAGHGVGDDLHSWAFDGYRRTVWHGGDQSPYQSPAWRSGDAVGVMLDLDEGTMSFMLNGKSLGVAFRDLERFDPNEVDDAVGYSPAASVEPTEAVTFNFGATQFRHLPPAGYRPLVLHGQNLHTSWVASAALAVAAETPLPGDAVAEGMERCEGTVTDVSRARGRATARARVRLRLPDTGTEVVRWLSVDALEPCAAGLAEAPLALAFLRAGRSIAGAGDDSLPAAEAAVAALHRVLNLRTATAALVVDAERDLARARQAGGGSDHLHRQWLQAVSSAHVAALLACAVGAPANGLDTLLPPSASEGAPAIRVPHRVVAACVQASPGSEGGQSGDCGAVSGLLHAPNEDADAKAVDWARDGGLVPSAAPAVLGHDTPDAFAANGSARYEALRALVGERGMEARSRHVSRGADAAAWEVAEELWVALARRLGAAADCLGADPEAAVPPPGPAAEAAQRQLSAFAALACSQLAVHQRRCQFAESSHPLRAAGKLMRLHPRLRHATELADKVIADTQTVMGMSPAPGVVNALRKAVDVVVDLLGQVPSQDPMHAVASEHARRLRRLAEEQFSSRILREPTMREPLVALRTALRALQTALDEEADGAGKGARGNDGPGVVALKGASSLCVEFDRRGSLTPCSGALSLYASPKQRDRVPWIHGRDGCMPAVVGAPRFFYTFTPAAVRVRSNAVQEWGYAMLVRPAELAWSSDDELLSLPLPWALLRLLTHTRCVYALARGQAGTALFGALCQYLRTPNVPLKDSVANSLTRLLRAVAVVAPAPRALTTAASAAHEGAAVRGRRERDPSVRDTALTARSPDHLRTVLPLCVAAVEGMAACLNRVDDIEVVGQGGAVPPPGVTALQGRPWVQALYSLWSAAEGVWGASAKLAGAWGTQRVEAQLTRPRLPGSEAVPHTSGSTDDSVIDRMWESSLGLCTTTQRNLLMGTTVMRAVQATSRGPAGGGTRPAAAEALNAAGLYTALAFRCSLLGHLQRVVQVFATSLASVAQHAWWTEEIYKLWTDMLDQSETPVHVVSLLSRLQDSIKLDARQLEWLDHRDEWISSCQAACTLSEAAQLLLPLERYMKMEGMGMTWPSRQKDWRRSVKAFISHARTVEATTLFAEAEQRRPRLAPSHVLRSRTVSTDGGQDGAVYAVENMLSAESNSYCSSRPRNVNVVVKLSWVQRDLVDEEDREEEEEDPDGEDGDRHVCRPSLVRKVILRRPPRKYTCPVSGALLFIFPERPTSADVERTKRFDSWCRHEFEMWAAAMRARNRLPRPGEPVAFLDIAAPQLNPWGQQASVPAWSVAGRYAVVKLLRAHNTHRSSAIQALQSEANARVGALDTDREAQGAYLWFLEGTGGSHVPVGDTESEAMEAAFRRDVQQRQEEVPPATQSPDAWPRGVEAAASEGTDVGVTLRGEAAVAVRAAAGGLPSSWRNLDAASTSGEAGSAGAAGHAVFTLEAVADVARLRLRCARTNSSHSLLRLFVPQHKLRDVKDEGNIDVDRVILVGASGAAATEEAEAWQSLYQSALTPGSLGTGAMGVVRRAQHQHPQDGGEGRDSVPSNGGPIQPGDAAEQSMVLPAVASMLGGQASSDAAARLLDAGVPCLFVLEQSTLHRVRAAPSLHSPVLSLLRKGNVVRVVERDGLWMRLDRADLASAWTLSLSHSTRYLRFLRPAGDDATRGSWRDSPLVSALPFGHPAVATGRRGHVIGGFPLAFAHSAAGILAHPRAREYNDASLGLPAAEHAPGDEPPAPPSLDGLAQHCWCDNAYDSIACRADAARSAVFAGSTLPYSSPAALSPAWTRGAERELIEYAQEYMRGRGRTPHLLHSSELPPVAQSQLEGAAARYPSIAKLPANVLRGRLDLIKTVALTLGSLSPLVDLRREDETLAPGLRMVDAAPALSAPSNPLTGTLLHLRSLLSPDTKSFLWLSVWSNSLSTQRSSDVVEINRFRASQAAEAVAVAPGGDGSGWLGAVEEAGEQEQAGDAAQGAGHGEARGGHHRGHHRGARRRRHRGARLGATPHEIDFSPPLMPAAASPTLRGLRVDVSGSGRPVVRRARRVRSTSGVGFADFVAPPGQTQVGSSHVVSTGGGDGGSSRGGSGQRTPASSPPPPLSLGQPAVGSEAQPPGLSGTAGSGASQAETGAGSAGGTGAVWEVEKAQGVEAVDPSPFVYARPPHLRPHALTPAGAGALPLLLRGHHSAFAQACAALRTVDRRRLRRRGGQAWFTKLIGEPAIDDGGVFREALSAMCEEVQSAALPLLVPCQPGARAVKSADGDGPTLLRVPNASACGRQHREWFRFLGVLMALATQDMQSSFPLSLPRLVWKRLAGEEVAVGDLQDVDSEAFNLVRFVRDSAEEVDEELFDDVLGARTFSAPSSGVPGRPLPLCPAGETRAVVLGNAAEYAEALFAARVREMDLQLRWIMQGMHEVLPSHFLALMSSDELELMVCGPPTVDLRVLRRRTLYTHGLQRTSPVVARFWEAMESFSTEERQRFLHFVWGRTRLPATEGDFGGIYFRLAPMFGRGGDPDQLLPCSSTCAFTLKLPNYSSTEILAQRLRYAMRHCVSVVDEEHPAAQVQAPDTGTGGAGAGAGAGTGAGAGREDGRQRSREAFLHRVLNRSEEGGAPQRMEEEEEEEEEEEGRGGGAEAEAGGGGARVTEPEDAPPAEQVEENWTHDAEEQDSGDGEDAGAMGLLRMEDDFAGEGTDAGDWLEMGGDPEDTEFLWEDSIFDEEEELGDEVEGERGDDAARQAGASADSFSSMLGDHLLRAIFSGGLAQAGEQGGARSVGSVGRGEEQVVTMELPSDLAQVMGLLGMMGAGGQGGPARVTMVRGPPGQGGAQQQQQREGISLAHLLSALIGSGSRGRAGATAEDSDTDGSDDDVE